MVTYNYSVTSDGPTSTIQEAINHIVNDLRTISSVTSDITILVGDGSYAGFTIPDSSLGILASSGYRLLIKSAGKYFPIIDFNQSENSVGIDIGSNNPNVTIQGFRVQYFSVGIRATLNSHYPSIINCIVSNNRNVGILIEQCEEAQVIQNTVVNGDYGVVIRLCKSAILLHNTIFQNGAIASERGKSISGVWAGLAMDYGNGISDSGVLHIIGNIIWNITGKALTLFYDDIERSNALVSNFNDILSDTLISIEDRRFYHGSNSRPRRTITSLLEWKQLGFDLDSISMDPKFIAPVQMRSDRNGYAIDLNLIDLSPVLGLVPSFFVNTSATSTWLPNYVDTNLVSRDILGNPRVQSNTAAGSNDKATNFGFYGQDIFSNPLDLNILKNCDVSPLNDVVSNKLDIWFPKIKKGFFYSNEREYYLYALKNCSTLSDLLTSKVRLPSRVDFSESIDVTVNGITVNNYNIIGDDLYIDGSGLNIVHGKEEVSISYYTNKWNNGGFLKFPITFKCKIEDTNINYYLPTGYVPGGPVIVTDDMSAPSDSEYISNREFTLTFDELAQRTKLTFADNSNLIINGQFDYSVSGEPLFWDSNGVTVESSNYSVAGYNIANIYPSGYISNEFSFNEHGNVFSFHASGRNPIIYNIKAYNNSEDIGFVITGSVPLDNQWKRYYIVLESTINTSTGKYVPTKPFEHILVDTHYIPDVTTNIDITLTNTSNTPISIDALQYENGQHITKYHRKPLYTELTVECETSASDYFIDTKQCMSSVRTYNTDGFLYISELPAHLYNGPEHLSITTLHELGWAEGRKLIIPWGRTKGKDKLKFRPDSKFYYEDTLLQTIITPVHSVIGVSDILIEPTEIVCLQGDTNGVGISIRALDLYGNSYGHAQCTINISDVFGRFPGFLFKKNYGLKEQLGQDIVSRLDNAGIINLTWVPPDKSKNTIVGVIPTPISNSTDTNRYSIIKTKYPVSLKNHGNITIIDSFGEPVVTTSSSITSMVISSSLSENYSKFKLPSPVAYGSVSVMIDNIYYSEVYSNNPEANQFYIDYESGIINVKGRFNSATISFKEVYAYTSINDPYSIILKYDSLFSGYSASDIFIIDFDFSIPLQVNIFDYSKKEYKIETFELIARNPVCSKAIYTNVLGIEI